VVGVQDHVIMHSRDHLTGDAIPSGLPGGLDPRQTPALAGRYHPSRVYATGIPARRLVTSITGTLGFDCLCHALQSNVDHIDRLGKEVIYFLFRHRIPFEYGFYWASPKPSIICLHISAGEHPVSCICAIILLIIPGAIWDIILGIAFVATSVKTAPANAPKEAARKYLEFEELGLFIVIWSFVLNFI
jgi:hypothetical protein